MSALGCSFLLQHVKEGLFRMISTRSAVVASFALAVLSEPAMAQDEPPEVTQYTDRGGRARGARSRHGRRFFLVQ